MNGFNVNCKDCARCLSFRYGIAFAYFCALHGEHIKDIEQNIDCYAFVKRRIKRS